MVALPYAFEVISLTCAFEAIANPTWSAVAFEAAGRVGAGGVSVTVMSSDLTLIDIWPRGKQIKTPCKYRKIDTALMV